MEFGVYIESDVDKVLIKGRRDDLLELAEYIRRVASSKIDSDHIHLDDLTLINSDSVIKNLIVEKVDKKNIQN